jgi:hypothetical protein
LHDLPDSKEQTGDFEAMIERNRKRLVRYAGREDKVWVWAKLCAVRDRWHDLRSTDRLADRRAFEAFSWIETVETDPDLERARRLITHWLRSGMEQNAWATFQGLHRTKFARLVDTFCEAVLARITYATPPRLQNNSSEHAVIRGIPAIALATGKRTSTVERWIESGHKPIANLAGQPAMLRDLAA